MVSLGEFAFRLARTPAAGFAVGLAFAHLDFVLPLRRVDSVGTGEGFGLYEHPRPVYGTWHHLLVPERRVGDLFALGQPTNSRVRRAVVLELEKQAENNPGIWISVNGGSRQDVGQVHFHLSDGCPFPGGMPDTLAVFDDWEASIVGLGGVPGVYSQLASGISLIRSPNEPGIRLL